MTQSVSSPPTRHAAPTQAPSSEGETESRLRVLGCFWASFPALAWPRDLTAGCLHGSELSSSLPLGGTLSETISGQAAGRRLLAAQSPSCSTQGKACPNIWLDPAF